MGVGGPTRPLPAGTCERTRELLLDRPRPRDGFLSGRLYAFLWLVFCFI